MSKKTVFEDSMLDIQKIKEALNNNAKEILRDVAREEINAVVKESLLESDFEEEDIETEMGDDTEMETTPMDSVDTTTDVTDITSTDIVDVDTPGQELGMDADALGGEELDMTAASDDDIIAVYKKLSGEDEIKVVGTDIHLTVSEPGEYVIKQNETPAADLGGSSEIDLGGELGADLGGDDDVEYEIEMDDDAGSEFGGEDSVDDLEDVPTPSDAESGEEEEEIEEPINELITKGTAQSGKAYSDLTDIKGAGVRTESVAKNQKLLTEAVAKNKQLLSEVAKLKSENDDVKKALKQFKDKLIETVVFNTNLTYVTKLFMENTTTKQEKADIIKRFDEGVSNLIESKKLYKTILGELNSKKITESIDNKITKGMSSGSSTLLTEKTAYVDPQILKVRQLMGIKG
jgi:hypothetical protein